MLVRFGKDCLAMDLGWQPFDYTIINQRILEELFDFACEASLQILRPGSSNHTYMGELFNIEQFFFRFLPHAGY